MHLIRTIVVFLILFPTVAFAAELGTMRISLITGDVQIYTADTEDWVAASINMPLREGDRIWVPEGALTEVQIQGGVYIRLGSATSFDLLALQEESFQFYLNGGHAYINNRKGGIDHIQVDTPLTSVGCYDNSLVMIDVTESGATDISVLKGYASAESDAGKTRVEAGNTLHTGGDMTAELSPLPPPDQWENWNRERDKKLAAGNRSLRYIPEDLDEYANELDDYGKWVYVTDYGYCWTPLSVSVDWSPYRIGRWCWIGGSYVWVSYEPWGWVPHHYGRWAFVANFGWCWVPPPRGGVYWAPGYVGWVNTPTYVAWVPLAPGDIYYGRGIFGPGSVNITNVTINRTVVLNYRNVNVRNAVTVINRTTFVSGRREPVRIRGNPFREANVEVGPPAIRPTRAAAIPVVRTIPSARKPPERVRRVSVDEIRRERTLVREERGSAFKQARPGAEMPVRKRSEPQPMIRGGERPALPPGKPQKREPQIAPLGERQTPAKAPEAARGRPAQPSARPEPPPHSASPAPPAATPPPRAASPATPAATPPPHSASPAPSAQRPQTPAPAEPATQTPRLAPRDERGGKPREPRWQEPTPAGRPAVQRQQPKPAAPAEPVPQKREGRGSGSVKEKGEAVRPAVPPTAPESDKGEAEQKPPERSRNR